MCIDLRKCECNMQSQLHCSWCYIESSVARELTAVCGISDAVLRELHNVLFTNDVETAVCGILDAV